jgi:hypothetical protein
MPEAVSIAKGELGLTAIDIPISCLLWCATFMFHRQSPIEKSSHPLRLNDCISHSPGAVGTGFGCGDGLDGSGRVGGLGRIAGALG